LRTSGSRPRRAHVATDADVTPNSDATCLRVIRSSPTPSPAGDSGQLNAVRIQTSGGAITFIGSPGGQDSGWNPGQRWLPWTSAPGKATGAMPNYPMPVALKMLLQLAARNIGQLTDIK
jgi:hypothetical protein